MSEIDADDEAEPVTRRRASDGEPGATVEDGRRSPTGGTSFQRPSFTCPERDLGVQTTPMADEDGRSGTSEDGASEDGVSENGARRPAKRRRGTRGGRGRKRKPAVRVQRARRDGDRERTAMPTKSRRRCSTRSGSENGASEIAVADNNGQASRGASNEPEDDGTYTPMSEWGSLDADEK